jgi:drug/metabolite transporter (DMT)-like permease
MTNLPWWAYVLLAGLAWGTYVPLIFFGGQMLSPLNPQGAPVGMGGRLASILCVGVAYFVLAVVIPVAMMAARDDAKADWRSVGLVFSGLAGVAGAVGAVCVIFASKAAVDQARADGINPATYRVYIAPLIFCLAPLINTLLSLVWHPSAKTGEWAVFHLDVPGWKLWAGIVLVAAGTFLVLWSKEEAESGKAPPKPTPEATPPPGSPP